MKLAKNVVFCETDYGAVLLDEQSGRYWTLNPTGALAMGVLLDGKDQGEAVDAVVELYPAQRDTVSTGVSNLLDQLHDAGLLEEK
ncbi:lasso peptide biosynthesis PqqD family chaperone [Amycolatopsis sp. EV170708-02-1]|uniref:lasso peptide biosynthesis PqqD family chaperone n=1 Tax=Amycolatopsis sp. EV170708-02-1 TaxID=2919322 RepID=UPI001F0BFC81|nr:lasso peptide biosynthesis PqqD family chaperone [Amycolatopsis sp. EV170708-02-1]UMP06829.1 lasso peptide biosynthesis PqqD family chaperone [Amycolatopsis sp. EV170708-02-1]